MSKRIVIYQFAPAEGETGRAVTDWRLDYSGPEEHMPAHFHIPVALLRAGKYLMHSSEEYLDGPFFRAEIAGIGAMFENNTDEAFYLGEY